MAESALDWSIESHPGAVVAAPAGRVDESTATAFADRLVAEIESASANATKLLAVDLAGVEYMSSRGLRALTLAQRKASELGVAVVLAQPNPVMREILAISRYDMVFKVFETNAEALG